MDSVVGIFDSKIALALRTKKILPEVYPRTPDLREALDQGKLIFDYSALRLGGFFCSIIICEYF